MKTKISYALCSIFVEGLEMKCPLCGVLVKSGVSHECSKPEKHSRRARKVTEANPELEPSGD